MFLKQLIDLCEYLFFRGESVFETNYYSVTDTVPGQVNGKAGGYDIDVAPPSLATPIFRVVEYRFSEACGKVMHKYMDCVWGCNRLIVTIS